MPIDLAIDGRYLRWLVNHIDEANGIYEDFLALRDQPVIALKIEGLIPIIKKIALMAGDFPPFYAAAMSSADQAEMVDDLKAQVGVSGKINWERLLEIAKLILPFLLPLFIENE